MSDELIVINDKKISAGDIYNAIKSRDKLRVDSNILYRRKPSLRYWERIDPDYEDMEIRKLFSEDSYSFVSSNKLSEVITLLKQDPTIQRNIINDNTELGQYLNVRNGIIDLMNNKNHKLITETQKPFNYYVNFNYLQGKALKDAPYFWQYLRSSLDYDANPQKAKLLLEILGYCISGLTGGKCAFFLIGKPDCGKSIILELLNHVVMEVFSSHLSLSSLGDRFNKVQLSYSRVNFCPELKNNRIFNLDLFKSVTSNEVISGEYKHQPIPVKFKAMTKLINAGNTMPTIGESDGTNAVFERMIFLCFHHSVPKHSRDLQLLQNLINEKDIIFSLAVDALRELIKRNFVFTLPSDSLEYRNHYIQSQNSVDDFIKSCCTFNEQSRTHLITLWNAYEKYCTGNCYTVNTSKYQFSQQLSSLDNVSKEKFRHNGESLWGLRGIELKSTSLWFEEKQDS